MKKDTIINIINDRFSNIQEIDAKNILRAEYTPEEKRAAIFYFDFNENGIPADLREYQNEFLVKDYYDNPGYLQWNFYLVFIRDSYKEEDKIQLEGNDIYTRKYLFKLEELKQFLSLSKYETQVETDVVVDWRKRLDEVDLNEIYTYVPVTEVRDRFLSNSVIKEPDIEQTSVEQDLPHAGLKNLKIDRLILEPTYRPYPRIRNFSFGKVNLFNGVNGVGKTSLLEAIELVICGKSLRNPDSSETDRSIKAFYSGAPETDAYSPANYNKYKERDLLWYKNDYPRGNKLFESFNRYNFFCSDAAFEYQNDGSVTSTLENLKKIALGSEFGRIRNRLKTLSGYLWPYQESYIRELDEYKIQLENLNKLIKKNSNNSAHGDLFKSFIEQCRKNSWKKALPESLESDLNQIGKDLADAHIFIQNIKDITKSSNFKSISEWQAELDRLKAIEEKAKGLQKEFETLEKEKQVLFQSQTNLKNHSSTLNSAAPYFNESESFQLDGIESLIQSTGDRIKNRRQLYIRYASLEKGLVSNSKSLSLKIASTNSNNLRIDLDQKIFSKEKKIDELKKSLTTLNQIIIEIKSKGRELKTENPNLNTCPLCETHFESSADLAERIERQVSQISNSVEIGLQDIELQELKRQSKENTDQNEILSQLNELEVKLLPENDIGTLTIQDLLLKFDQLEKELNEEDTKFQNLKELNLKLKTKGLTETNLLDVKRNLSTLFPSLIFNPSNNSQFQELLKETDKQLNEINSKININNGALKGKNDEISALLITQTDHKIALKAISESIVESEQVLKSFNKLKEYIEVADSVDPSVLDLEIGALISRLTVVRGNLMQLEQIANAKKQIPELEISIIELEEKKQKLEPALKVIGEIASNQDEDSILAEFINTNSKKISEVFASIHSPHEFSEIRFEKNHVYLSEFNREQRTIKKISSGQRSALVLSIFLTLNKQLENGPDILIFDDPVAFTDDLNILSFLDFLRELVINEKKQLFFATANKRLAGLFEKKFSFLDDMDFKRYVLTRDSKDETGPAASTPN